MFNAAPTLAGSYAPEDVGISSFALINPCHKRKYHLPSLTKSLTALPERVFRLALRASERTATLRWFSFSPLQVQPRLATRGCARKRLPSEKAASQPSSGRGGVSPTAANLR